MTNPRYVVMNEHTLGYIYAEQPDTLCVLHGSVLKGGRDWKNGPALITPLDEVRDATLKDFSEYRCVPPPSMVKP